MSLHAVDTEKRQFNRIAFDTPVTIRNSDYTWQSTLIDVSINGASIIKPKNWNKSKNTRFELSIQLDDAEISMQVKLIHYKVERIGFQCISIDNDSTANLKYLLESNQDNQD